MLNFKPTPEKPPLTPIKKKFVHSFIEMIIIFTYRKFQYFSPLERVEWEFSDQKDVFRSLFSFLKEESRSDCYLAILQAIKVFTYVFCLFYFEITMSYRMLCFREFVQLSSFISIFTGETKIC